MTITCTLMGGLGNQLFQIFATIAYAIKHGHSFKFLALTTLGDGVHSTQRHTYWQTFMKALVPFLVDKFDMTKHAGVITHKEPRFNYDVLPAYNKQYLISLYGYFQSYKYFDEYYGSIVSMLQIVKQRDALLQRMAPQTISAVDWPHTVSMHFRLGDYKKLQQYHPVLTTSYYVNAVRQLVNAYHTHPGVQLSPLTVLYFYEPTPADTKIVEGIIVNLRETFFSADVQFIAAPTTGLSDWEEMLLMSACYHHIIANSTFSWWGAYFGCNAKKMVCYPSVWFGPAHTGGSVVDLFPSNWTCIAV